MEEENKMYIKHKVQAGFNYTVYRNDRNGKTYYKICVVQKAFDGQESKHYIPVTFKKDVELQDKTKIKIKVAVENVYKKGYDTISTYMILDFDNLSEALQEFNESDSSYDEDPPF